MTANNVPQMLETWLLGKVILEGYNYGKHGLSVEQFNKFCKRIQVTFTYQNEQLNNLLINC